MYEQRTLPLVWSTEVEGILQDYGPGAKAALRELFIAYLEEGATYEEQQDHAKASKSKSHGIHSAINHEPSDAKPGK